MQTSTHSRDETRWEWRDMRETCAPQAYRRVCDPPCEKVSVHEGISKCSRELDKKFRFAAPQQCPHHWHRPAGTGGRIRPAAPATVLSTTSDAAARCRRAMPSERPVACTSRYRTP